MRASLAPSAFAAPEAMRSSSSLTLRRSSSERAISARSADSVARRRETAASSLTTAEVTTYSQGKPVARVVQRERVNWRQKEEVEHEHRRHRHANGEDQAPRDCNRQHCEHVQRAQAQDWHKVLEHSDHAGHDCHRTKARDHAEPRVSAPRRRRYPRQAPHPYSTAHGPIMTQDWPAPRPLRCTDSPAAKLLAGRGPHPEAESRALSQSGMPVWCSSGLRTRPPRVHRGNSDAGVRADPDP